MARPLMAATRVFDFIQMSDYAQTEQELSVLLDHASAPRLQLLVAQRLQCSATGIG